VIPLSICQTVTFSLGIAVVRISSTFRIRI
jgi:hypothetical protein